MKKLVQGGGGRNPAGGLVPHTSHVQAWVLTVGIQNFNTVYGTDELTDLK